MDASMHPTTEQCYTRYADMLYRLAYAQLSSAHDAEDAVADVFEKYLSRSPAFRSREHEKAWFIRVLLNRCKDMQRHRAIRIHTPLEDAVNLAAVPEEANDVLRAVMTLPEPGRTAVLLHYFEGFSLEETAALQRTTAAAVKMRLMRSRNALEALLKGAGI